MQRKILSYPPLLLSYHTDQVRGIDNDAAENERERGVKSDKHLGKECKGPRIRRYDLAHDPIPAVPREHLANRVVIVQGHRERWVGVL
jgi:hypothetical protein